MREDNTPPAPRSLRSRPGKDKVSQLSATEHDLALARSLFEAVQKSVGAANANSHPKDWAKHLAALREFDAVEQAAIDETLAWHVASLRTIRHVKAYSGESFRHHFVVIRAKYRESNPYASVSVSEPAAKIAERLKNKGWPVPVKSLPAAVQNSITVMEMFRARLISLKDKVPKPEEGYTSTSPRLDTLCDLLLQENPLTWVENWWEHARRQALKWPDFDGGLLIFAMREDDPWFKKWVNGVSRARFGVEKGDWIQEELERELAK